MAKKKGKKKGKGGGKGGGASKSNLTMAVGSSLSMPSSFHLWKLRPSASEVRVAPILPGPRYEEPKPPQHRSAPQLKSKKGKSKSAKRVAPAPPARPSYRVPLAVVKAATAGNVAAVGAWLEDGVEPGGAAPSGPTQRQASTGPEAAEQLGADYEDEVLRVNRRWDSPSGLLRDYTLLMVAAQLGNDALADVCIRHGADLDAADARGHTALIIASAYGQRSVVQRLLLAGCRTDVLAKLWPTLPDGDQRNLGSAADFAQTRNFPLLARVIRAHEYARLHGHGPPRLDLEVVDACRAGDAAAVSCYLECGGSVDAVAVSRQRGMYTLLMHAAEAGHARLVRALLSHGADQSAVTAHRGDGMTALTLAAQAGHQHVVRLLLHGPDEVATVAESEVPHSYRSYRSAPQL
jgi:hypothetical protein